MAKHFKKGATRGHRRSKEDSRDQGDPDLGAGQGAGQLPDRGTDHTSPDQAASRTARVAVDPSLPPDASYWVTRNGERILFVGGLFGSANTQPPLP